MIATSPAQSPLKIAVIGASGAIGSKVVREALARGHAVTALCRDGSRVAAAAGLTVQPVDLFDRPALSKALAGHDVAISCYSPGHAFDPDRNVYKEVIEAVVRIIAAVKANPGLRLIFVGGASSLLDEQGVALVDAPDYGYGDMARMPPVFLDWLSKLPVLAHDPTRVPKGGADVPGPDYVPALARALLFFKYDRNFAWSFFSPPPALVPGPRSGGYSLGDDHVPMVDGHYATLSYADAAVALLDEAEQDAHHWQHWTAFAS